MRDIIVKCGEALYGPRFQRELAVALRVNERTMRRWIAGDTEPPDGVAEDLMVLVRVRIKRLAAILERKAG
jgi:hypothetical protein